MKWLGEHRSWLEKTHPGCWVAVEGSELIAVGPDLVAVLEEAKQKGVENPFISGVKAKRYQGIIMIRRWQ